ncbi:MAG: hypothetical protein DME42_08235 [Verrucomicrobia bacterium]|nr:MAG: hypothetical protein DME42_08235 [Verrucomicrobiota bacterium]
MPQFYEGRGGSKSENDVALTGCLVNKSDDEAHSLVVRNGSAPVFPRWMRNNASWNSGCEGGDGAKIRRRNAGRLYYRPPGLQTRLQILGLRPASGATVERVAARNVEREAEVGPRSRAPRYPEFVLKGYEVISTNPPPIFSSQLSGRAQAEVSRYLIEKPQL